MYRALPIYITALLAGILPARPSHADTALKSLPLSQLEQRLAEIDTELGQLAHYSLRSGVGTIGYRSMRHTTPEQTEWIEVDLGRELPIEEVVLVPALWRDSTKGFQADGFPVEFRILAGTDNDRIGTVLANIHPSGRTPHRIAPLVIPVETISASWVRIEVSRLSRRAFDNQYVFQLSEILIFSDEENVALRKPVAAASVHPNSTTDQTWSTQNLTDGFMPYLMDAAQGPPSLAYIRTGPAATQPGDAPPALTLDLKKEYLLSRIHLHAVDQSDTVPQGHLGDVGLPRHLLIEGATRPDFSDAVPLFELKDRTLMETGPIMMWNIPATTCRFVRLISIQSIDKPQIGFAEIEFFSAGQNVARNKPVSASFPLNTRDTNRSLTALTDGRNLYGNILPIRTWLNELARRHDLETKRPLIAEELNLRYAHQKANLNRVSWLAVLLVVAVAFTILIDRMLRQRQIARIRERFAADLHDELGANLHAIGLLGDLAKDAVHSPDELIETVEEIRALTERSGAAARHCADMQLADIFGKLPDDMRRTARRIMADLEYSISIEGEEWLEKLRPRTKADLFLFYKESLVNISRHSGATEVSIKLTADSNQLCLTIQDNGQGLEGEVPSSLKRRARLLGGQVACTASSNEGTCITLKFRPRKLGLKK